MEKKVDLYGNVDFFFTQLHCMVENVKKKETLVKLFPPIIVILFVSLYQKLT